MKRQGRHKQLLNDNKKNILKLERGSTTSRSVENLLRKGHDPVERQTTN
jgi:hypothetical protein